MLNGFDLDGIIQFTFTYLMKFCKQLLDRRLSFQRLNEKKKITKFNQQTSTVAIR